MARVGPADVNGVAQEPLLERDDGAESDLASNSQWSEAMYVRPDALQPERGSLEVTSTAPKAASSTPSGFYFLPHDELAALRAKAEEVLEPFARDFRQFWDVVSNNEATVEMVDACLMGAYSLGITQPHFRPWLPLSKIGETVAILHIMRCNLCLERGDLARAVHDAQAAVALSTVPGTPQCAPKATSSMWFAQACRALGRACVKLGNSLRAAEHLSHAINVLKETGKAEATAVDLLLWRVMGHCWPLPQEPEFSPVDTHLQRMEHAPSPEKDAATFDPPPLDSCLGRDFCTCQVAPFAGTTLRMHKFSAARHEDSLFLFGGLYVQNAASAKGCSINSVVRIDLATLTPESIRTLGEEAAPKRPHPRHGHCAVSDGGSMYVFGGQGDDPQQAMDADGVRHRHWSELLWRLDLQTAQWHRHKPVNGRMMARTDACAVHANGKIYLFGGCMQGADAADDMDEGGERCDTGPRGPNEECADVWELDLQTLVWTALKRPEGPQPLPHERAEPEPRHSAVMWCWGDSLFVFGGAVRERGLDCTYGDLWRFDIPARQWSAVPLRGNPPASRSGAMLACDDGNSVLLCGGYSSACVCAAPEAADGSVPMDQVDSVRRLMYQCAYMHDSFELDRVSLLWRQLRRRDSLPALSSARSSGAATIYKDRLMIFGGYLGMMPDATIPGDCNVIRWRHCQACGAEAAPGGAKLMQCAGCAVANGAPALYCSATCQQADWPVHQMCCSGVFRITD